MYWIFFISAIILTRTESAFGKANGLKGGKNITFNLLKMFFAFLVGLIFVFVGGFSFHGGTLFFACLYGISLFISCFAGLKALACGSMALTSMIASFSLVIPCLVGLIFLHENISVFGIVGLILVCVSIVLLTYKKQSSPISIKCWVYSIITLFTNGVCSVVQKLHQTEYPNSFRGEFMLFSTACALIIFAIVYLFSLGKKNNKEQPQKRQINRTAIIFGAIAGVCNCVANFFILYLSASENASVLFPMLSALNTAVACLVGRLIFKEKISILQYTSIAIGIVAIVLLKI